jgi:hypothetical protein
MASFVVETFVPEDDPDRFVADARSLRAAIRAAPEGRARPRYLRSYLVPADAMGFHVIEAETVDDAARLTRVANIEAERIVTSVSAGDLRAQMLAQDGPG